MVFRVLGERLIALVLGEPEYLVSLDAVGKFGCKSFTTEIRHR